MQDQEQEENKMDVITVDVPLFIRLLEFAREDATDDMMLHDVAEKLIEMCADGDIMQMEQYDEIVGSKEDKAATSGMNAVEDNMHPQNKDMDTINEQRWLKLAGINEDESAVPTITKAELTDIPAMKGIGQTIKLTLSNGKIQHISPGNLEGMYGGDADDLNSFVGEKWED
jgi:hypothetical protein